MDIKSGTDEIKDILNIKLPEDLVLMIINIRDRMIRRGSKIYWRTITPKYNLIPIALMWAGGGFYQKKIILNTLIKRINGSFKNLRNEIDEIRYLKLQNKIWTEAWNGGRF
tara:strand:+ start:828 stop:1160 length:333 start_codon:yes stop_codon:yes gene_type:complete